MRKSRLYFLFFFVFISTSIFSQDPKTIRFGKSSDLIYFFQIGNKSDTIIAGKSDAFCLLVPDSLKDRVVIQVENAQLIQGANDDSIVHFKHLAGMKYESFFVANESSKQQNISYELKTLVNGVSSSPRNKILIQIIDRRKNKVLIENIFFALP